MDKRRVVRHPGCQWLTVVTSFMFSAIVGGRARLEDYHEREASVKETHGVGHEESLVVHSQNSGEES